MARKNVPAIVEGGGGMPTEWLDVVKSQAEKNRVILAKAPASAGNVLSFDNVKFTVNGNALPNPLLLVPLAITNERTYYDTTYQPGVITSPACYSFDMERPHKLAQRPASDRCETCQYEGFGSGERGARACKITLRVAFIWGDRDELMDAKYVTSAPIITMKPSVLNTLALKSILQPVIDKGAPVFAAMLEMHTAPDNRTKYALSFKGMNYQPGSATAKAILERLAEAESLVARPYPVIDGDSAARRPIKGAVSREPMRRTPRR